MESLNFWGNVASIVGLIVLFYHWSIKAISRIRDGKKQQEKKYLMAEEKMKVLFSLSTNHIKRNDAFFFANTILEQGRLLESRARSDKSQASFGLIGFSIMFIINIQLMTIEVTRDILSMPTYKYLFPVALIICGVLSLLIAHIIQSKEIKELTALNDAYAVGITDAMEKYINRDILENQKGKKQN